MDSVGGSKRLIKIPLSSIYLLIVLLAAFMSYKQGLSQYLVKTGLLSKDPSKFKQAIKIDPSNAEAYTFRGFHFQQKGEYKSALSDFKEATRLRSNDYFLWLQIGFANNKLKNYEAAQTAFEQSHKLAPNYFQPRQYLGFHYLRQNKIDQGFAHLSQAAAAQPSILPQILEFAYQIYLGDSAAIDRAIQIETLAAKKEIAAFFVKKNIPTDKTLAFLTSYDLSDEDKNKFINELLKNRNYNAAFNVWSSKVSSKEVLADTNKNLILNGDFEKPITKNENVFNWQITEQPNVDLKLDPTDPFTGSASLQIVFNGKSNPTQSIISQLVIIKPNQTYNLAFNIRTNDLKTGGLPIVSVYPADAEEQILRTPPLPPNNNQWENFNFNFKTNEKNSALIIKVQRLDCPQNPCPVFGELWLDNFKLQEIK